MTCRPFASPLVVRLEPCPADLAPISLEDGIQQFVQTFGERPETLLVSKAEEAHAFELVKPEHRLQILAGHLPIDHWMLSSPKGMLMSEGV